MMSVHKKRRQSAHYRGGFFVIGSARVMCDLKSGCERVQLDRTETRTEREWTARIAAEFKKIGMPPHMLGHVYLCDAVVLSILLPKCMRQKMYQIYVVIGERFGTTPARGGEKHPHGDQGDVGAGAGPGGPCWNVWRELSEQQPLPIQNLWPVCT